MDAEVVSEAETTVLKLVGDVTVADAERLRDLLMTAVTSVGPVAVETRGVERWDAATIQLLLATHNTCRSQSRSFAVRGLSSSRLATWRLFGMPEDALEQGEAANG